MFRPLLGVDAYAYLNHACYGTPFPDSIRPLTQIFFENLPCVEWVRWFGLIFFMVLSVFLLKKISETQNEKSYIGYTILLAPALVLLLLQWEDDILGFPLCLIGWYLYQKNKKIEAVLWLLATGYLVWGGAIWFLIAISLNFLPALLVSTPIIILNFDLIKGNFFGFSGTSEALPVFGFFSYCFLLFGLANYKKLERKDWFLVLASFLTLKNAWMASVVLLPLFDSFLIQNKEFFNQFWRITMVFGLVTCLFLFVFFTPSQNLLNHLSSAIEKSNQDGVKLGYDWDVCYYLESQGFKRDLNQGCGGGGDLNFHDWNGYVISHDLNNIGTIFSTFDGYYFGSSKTFINDLNHD
jgi:hypothetical protein